jgi:hypothetical protein
MSPRRRAKKAKQAMAATATQPKNITRSDIESKLRELQGEVDENLESARSVGLVAGLGAAVLLVLLAYILGRRRGKKRQMVLEIRRI